MSDPRDSDRDLEATRQMPVASSDPNQGQSYGAGQGQHAQHGGAGYGGPHEGQGGGYGGGQGGGYGGPGGDGPYGENPYNGESGGKSGGRAIALVVGLLVLLAAIGAAVWFFFIRDDGDSAEPEAETTSEEAPAEESTEPEEPTASEEATEESTEDSTEDTTTPEDPSEPGTEPEDPSESADPGDIPVPPVMPDVPDLSDLGPGAGGPVPPEDLPDTIGDWQTSGVVGGYVNPETSETVFVADLGQQDPAFMQMWPQILGDAQEFDGGVCGSPQGSSQYLCVITPASAPDSVYALTSPNAQSVESVREVAEGVASHSG